MSSEYRLHPTSLLFNFGAQAKELLIPGLLVLLSARQSDRWEVFGMFLLIPYLFVIVGRYISFRYRYDEHELVVRWGLVFRKERHIPYARIQNLDAVQNPLHRAFGVVKVRLETGAGQEPEATMSVLPLEALETMRQRVFQGRRAPVTGPEEIVDAPSDPTAAPIAPPVDRGTVLLRLSPRDLMIAGLIENRGMVLIAALFGLVWETGFLEGFIDRAIGDEAAGRGTVRQLIRAIFADGQIPWRQIALMAGAFIGLLAAIRLLSMVWGLVRLYGFTLTRTGDDLRSEYGLFTRVVATIPLRRIQTVTTFEGPWHQWFGWAAVRVTTAGGAAVGNDASSQREWLAPIISRDAVSTLLRDVMPQVELEHVTWQPVHPRARWREWRVSTAIATVISGGLYLLLGWLSVVVFALMVTWSFVASRQYVRHLGWTTTDLAVAFRSGWLWRRMTVARFTRVQAVTLQESPFDRRTGMASVRVDTAGGSAAHGVDIPYLARDVASGLFQRLSAEAARTQFKW